MLTGIDPALSGELLHHLDAMGHSDAVVLADAHFPAARVGRRWIDLPLVGTPRLLQAVCTVLPLDSAPAVDLMATADGSVGEVQQELLAAAGVDADGARFLDRFRFYETAAEAFVVVRTGETRVYGNVLLRKGVVTPVGGGSR
ncbi:RbsD/FucU family protein [Nakamurella endophytica]|uniref:L-fucose mutarotase n=1 Tax=Nakamurella endophytica TaxID=1748367 RepID=A0A917WNY7_9ACTN|nr:RbsD/FucU domain-containing protein [Nakamurella endophytica]GGM17689.1 L-fucose mutarotase [Nakamurella endophytica]